jgi:hypothetical protein
VFGDEHLYPKSKIVKPKGGKNQISHFDEIAT